MTKCELLYELSMLFRLGLFDLIMTNIMGLSYEKELDIDNKLHNYLKIRGILNNVFRPQKKTP